MGFTGYLGQTVNELNYELESHYNFLYSITGPVEEHPKVSFYF